LLATSLLFHLAHTFLLLSAGLLLLLALLELHLLAMIEHWSRSWRNYLLSVLSRNLVHLVDEPNISSFIHIPELLGYRGSRIKCQGGQDDKKDAAYSGRVHTLLCLIWSEVMHFAIFSAMTDYPQAMTT
jgi:hypothetical protein